MSEWSDHYILLAMPARRFPPPQPMPARGRTPRTLPAVAEILRTRYRDFNHYNLTNPLNELLFIICSTRTMEREYRETYASLRAAFPANGALAAATVPAVAEAIQRGGLSTKKASQIHEICARLVERFGRPTLDPLRQWPTPECERFLLALPGVGRKVARCVMLYSLRRDVFPVDEHCWRVSRRLGWIRQTRRNRSGSPRDEDRLQEKIPPEYRHSLHVNLISLGRQFCVRQRPLCESCPISSLCPRIGVPR
jgi:endonuclease III